MAWEPSVPATVIGVAVRDGVVTLSGQVEPYWAKWSADRAADRVSPTGVEARIENSFTRLSSIDASRIIVWSSGGEVTLRGTVRSWSERNEEEEAAYAAPGVGIVHNHFTVFDG